MGGWLFVFVGVSPRERQKETVRDCIPFVGKIVGRGEKDRQVGSI